MIQFFMMLLLAFTNNSGNTHYSDNQKSNITTLSRIQEDPETESGDGNGHGNGGNTGGNTGQLPPPSILP